MPLIDLIEAPYSLSLGDSVYAKIIAINQYGQGIYSSAGNGATLVLVPSPPLSLTNNEDVTAESIIGFTWSNGKTSGGRAIIDYRVWYDQGMDTFIVLDDAVTEKSYTTEVPILAG
jgi:hypothetical protein